MTRSEFLAQERERVAKRATITAVSANLLRWLGGISSIPYEMAEAARAVLRRAQQNSDIRDWRVYAFGNDLHLQLNTLGQGLQNPKVHTIAYEAATAALSLASDLGCYRPADGKDFFRLSPSQRIEALHLRSVEFPFTERGSEPIVIAKLMNGAVGAFNRMLFNLFFHPDKGSHQRLDGTRFIAVVENVNDLCAGKTRRRLYIFGDRPHEENLVLIYPFLKEPLAFSRDQVGDWAELLSMIANPAEWVISAIFAAHGRFVADGERWQASRHEPVAVVSVEPALPGVAVADPIVILRLQSGLPAVGEAHFNLGADFHFTIGGPGGGYHVGVMPVTMAQAQLRAEEQGTAKLVA
ncbi:MAG TPA: fructose 1,6-bisphosphatase, partial [Candidatus Binatia bacterium]|nr:fructose 1,6-bisphosphatase [Candidatus Binatia bacterium]